ALNIAQQQHLGAGGEITMCSQGGGKPGQGSQGGSPAEQGKAATHGLSVLGQEEQHSSSPGQLGGASTGSGWAALYAAISRRARSACSSLTDSTSRPAAGNSPIAPSRCSPPICAAMFSLASIARSTWASSRSAGR